MNLDMNTHIPLLQSEIVSDSITDRSMKQKHGLFELYLNLTNTHLMKLVIELEIHTFNTTEYNAKFNMINLLR